MAYARAILANMEYKIVSASLESIEELVNGFLRNGWRLHGGLTTVQGGNLLLQVVVKLSEETDQSDKGEWDVRSGVF